MQPTTAFSCDREDGWREVNGDEEKNDEEENAAHNVKTTSIPSKLKATIQFGYEDGMKAALGTEDFDAPKLTNLEFNRGP